MSAIYNLEPQPTASAIIHTTLGEIMVELFAKQTPLTCRNFLQLSLDGYYDGTVFHRLVPNFILQGGDPTGTGNGGESIYDGGAFSGDLDPWPMDLRTGQNAGPTGINFADEFHSRLKFNRRGLLAMANESKPNTNGSQFFFTLDKTEELTGRNTLFGRVAGDTIYNLAKIGESEVAEGTERPLYAVKIERIEILVNPFEDMKKRTRTATHTTTKPAEKEKKKKRKAGGKQLLSFGDDEGEEQEISLPKKPKFDTRLIADEEPEEPVTKPKSSKPKAKSKKITIERDDENGAEPIKASEAVEQRKPTAARHDDDDDDMDDVPEPPKKTALELANEEMAAIKASMRREVHPGADVVEKKKSALENMIPETSVRGARKRRPGGNTATAANDASTLKFLAQFQSKLGKAVPEKETAELLDKSEQGASDQKAADDEEAEQCDLHFIVGCQSCTSWDKQEKEESDDEGWMGHKLSFAADRLGKDLNNRRKAEEELVVIDPRAKERSFKDKRAGRDGRSGDSGGRAWDQRRDMARNAQMAKSASLAGRGAK
ncbi:Putative Cyclophilin type peptidyl-prolyl cis-trans isomerase/CLD [[Torrubiella] hemipterigena]|uniref:peptidylprolyl isomerase n=1 Tax=[Torrubiella] hemipterigena TaxID=1531966 RepID=A0A0A1TSN2_9HYPO|nr:Putative Cyclophilin type peptidyl-prolyl cis-trans isomerase/CLD [[Torrubiella] hemipterigena]